MSWHDSYFVKIGGASYKAALIDSAASRSQDGPLSLADARALWRLAQDGRGVTATEQRTLRYILESTAATPEACAFLTARLEEQQPSAPTEAVATAAVASSWLPTGRWLPVGGLLPSIRRAWRCIVGGGEDELLELAKAQLRDGLLTFPGAQALLAAAQARGCISPEALQRLLEACAPDEAAEALLSHALQGGPEAPCGEAEEERPGKRLRRGAFTALFCGGGADVRGELAELLASAEETLDVALFALTDDKLTAALLQRHRAGVRLRLLADNGAERAFATSDLEQLRRAGVEVRLDRSSMHMHHKFAVLDGAVVANGSLNWTAGALQRNRENVVVNRCRGIAAAFAAEFQRLWDAFSPEAAGEPGPAPDGQWHGGRAVLFFPDRADANFSMLLEEVRSAQTSLDVAVFTLTVAELKEALREAHGRGVRVRVITDDRQARFVGGGKHIEELRGAGIEVRTDGPGGSMHHKFCVLDGETLLNGSFNWTRQAEDGNNENVVIYRKEPGLARSFTQEFERLWQHFAPR